MRRLRRSRVAMASRPETAKGLAIQCLPNIAHAETILDLFFVKNLAIQCLLSKDRSTSNQVSVSYIYMVVYTTYYLILKLYGTLPNHENGFYRFRYQKFGSAY